MLQERVVLPGRLRIEISLEARGKYRLACLAPAGLVVEYLGYGARHRRRMRGRESVYEFRSVEQLRYDFERDVADARSQG